MEETNLTISLRDLVASGCLSKCALSLHGEDGVCSGLSRRENRPFVNAAKLSLLIAQSFVRLGDKGCYAIAAPLTLDDFAVSLTLATGAEGAATAETCNPTAKDADDLAPVRENELLDDGDIRNSSSDFIYGEADAGQSNRIVPVGPSAGAGEICAKSNIGRLRRTHSGDTTNTIVAPEPRPSRPPARDNKHSENRSLSPDREIFDIVCNTTNECGGGTPWTLLGMELSGKGRFTAETKLSNASWDIDSPEGIQHLGKLVYNIMISSRRIQSRDSDTLPEALEDLVLEEAITGNNFDCDGTDIDLIQRNSKMQRFRDRSIFNQFIVIGFPVAVARLLSDMIDIGKDGSSDSPFTSLEDVIKDLGQMATHPHLYLDDPREDFSASALQFGKRCYGRGDEVAVILEIASNLEDKHKESEFAEVIFVRGKGGSGKTHLCQSVGDFLIGQGWMVLNARFERGMEHESRAIVLSLFDKLVSTLVAMRDGGVDTDVDFSRLATKAVLEAFDRDSMSLLAEFLPSMKDLMEDFEMNNPNAADCMDNSIWQLVYLLSTLLATVLSLNGKSYLLLLKSSFSHCELCCAVVSGRIHHTGPRVMIHVDDLQWSDATMLKLMFEIVVSIGKLPHARERFLFVGMSRSHEKSISHHHTTQYDSLSESKHVNITSIDLGGLTSDDLVEMAMTEMRLPERLVRDLACIIHKKTSGHALFAVQLLDTLVRDSVVVYSPLKHRYDWDDTKINALQTLTSVASLIASNISSLPAAALQSLRILSTLGMKSEMSIINHLKDCSTVRGGNDIASYLPILVDAGIVESDGSSVVFCHDLLHQAVYDGMSGAEQKSLHFDLGLYLGADTQLDDSNYSIDSCKSNGENDSHVDPFVIQSTITTIATDQINHAGPDFVVDHARRVRFSHWNLSMATYSSRHGNFLAALHYYNKGISFLDQQWLKDNQEHCLRLYKGASEASLVCGKFEQVPQFANIIIENVSFENSIEAQCLLLKSLEAADKSQVTMATALELLPKLGFCLPGIPRLYFSYFLGYSMGNTPPVIKQRMKNISDISHNVDELISSGQSQVDATQKIVCNILDSIMFASRLVRSPYFPLIVCENTSYILKQQCLCVESIPSFCNYSTLLVWLEENYTEARKWAVRAQKIMENAPHNPYIHTHVALYGVALAWFIPLKESSQHLFKAYELGMKAGDVTMSMIALAFHLRYLFYDGTELCTLQRLYGKYLPQMAKYNISVAKLSINEILYINFLTGRQSSNPFSIFEGMIPDENSLMVECQSKKNYSALLGLYVTRFFRNYLNGDYDEAEKSSMLVQSLPNSSIPYIANIYYHFTCGLLAHKMYRDGKGDKYFDKGKAMLEKMKTYSKHSGQICRNKLLLLAAESHSSMCEVEKAKELYDASIQFAIIHENSHDLAEAYELKGKYLLSIVDSSGSTACFKKAYACYMKWGAVHIAEKLQKDYNFDVDHDSHHVGVAKRIRDW